MTPHNKAVERYEAICEMRAQGHSLREVAYALGISKKRVRQIITKREREIQAEREMRESRDPLCRALGDGRISRKVFNSLGRGGYGRTFDFAKLLTWLRSDTFNPHDFHDLGRKRLDELRLAFLSEEEIQALAGGGRQRIARVPRAAMGKRSKLTLNCAKVNKISPTHENRPSRNTTMFQFPKEPKKIRERIRSYERALRKEHETFGAYDDSFGKRYLLGPLYLLVGDIRGAVRSFDWFEKTFPDDIGEPFHDLCWALALYQSGNTAAACQKLRQAMLSNLYLLPHLLGFEQERLDIWHGSNYEQKEYLQSAPPEIWDLWDQQALGWANSTYNSPELLRVRARYIEIHRQLKDERPGARRSQMVAEAFKLRDANQSQKQGH